MKPLTGSGKRSSEVCFMTPTRGFELLVHQHQEDLMRQAGSRRARRSALSEGQDNPTQRSATGLPVAGGRAVHRAMAPRFGARLIELGTRLGGATVRPSN